VLHNIQSIGSVFMSGENRNGKKVENSLSALRDVYLSYNVLFLYSNMTSNILDTISVITGTDYEITLRLR